MNTEINYLESLDTINNENKLIIKRLNGSIEYVKAIFQVESLEDLGIYSILTVLESYLWQIKDMKKELETAKEEIKQM